jgi:hypothetical protein
MINSKIEEYIYFLNEQNYFNRIIPNFKIVFLKFDKIIDPGSFETLLTTNVFYKNSKNEIMSLDIVIYESDFLEWMSEERLNKINQILDNDDRS